MKFNNSCLEVASTSDQFLVEHIDIFWTGFIKVSIVDANYSFLICLLNPNYIGCLIWIVSLPNEIYL